MLAAPAISPTPSLRGIALVLLAYFFFGCMDAGSKYLAASYPAPQIVWVRFVLFAVVLVGFNLRRGLLSAFRSARPGLQVFRSLLLVTEIGMVVAALRHLGIADMQAIFAIAPLVVTALSVPLLASGSACGAGARSASPSSASSSSCARASASCSRRHC